MPLQLLAEHHTLRMHAALSTVLDGDMPLHVGETGLVSILGQNAIELCSQILAAVGQLFVV